MTNKSISLEFLPLRSVTIIVAFLLAIAGYFAFNWAIGSTLAKLADSKETATLSTEMSPSDPQSYFSLAYLNEKSFLPAELPIALANYEKAVSVSPHDFRLWMSLAKAREQSGDMNGAEKALRKAVELAPNYSQTRWALGNQLLRQKNEDEAFAEIRKAVEADPKYVNPAVTMAWQLFDGDVAQISQKIGDSVPIKAGLAPFLVRQKRLDEALTIWNAIPNEEKTTTYKKNGENLIASFLEAKSFRNAQVIQSQIAGSEGEKFNTGAIFNGDFEKEVKKLGGSIFDWTISDGAQPQISLDPSQKRGGERSLILLFNSSTGQESRSVQQTVVVESGKSYKFEAFYRTDLKALSGFKWEIVDAVDGKVLASTSETGLATSSWSPINVDFTTTSMTQAIIIRLTKVACKQTLCPISGKVWFDDLSLK